MNSNYPAQSFKLSDLNEDERQFVIKMPYRVGMFISLSDTKGGTQADEQEIRALEVIVTSYAQDFCKSEFVQTVMNKTVEHKEKWQDWISDIETVPQECEKLIDLLEKYLYRKELDAMKANLLEIGRSVALAYRELEEDASFLKIIQQKLNHFSHTRTARKSGQEPLRWQEYKNVSPDEHKALTTLAKSLKI